jgi:hypothetical protein
LHDRDVADAHAGEKALLDEFGQARFFVRQFVQCDIQAQQLVGTQLAIDDAFRRVERDDLQPDAAALVGHAREWSMTIWRIALARARRVRATVQVAASAGWRVSGKPHARGRSC